LQSSSTPLHVSAADIVAETHDNSALPAVHWKVPAAHGPFAPGTMHVAPRFTMLSNIPSQSSSTPEFAQVSLLGMTAPVHAPSVPFAQACVPATHLPTPSVPVRPL